MANQIGREELDRLKAVHKSDGQGGCFSFDCSSGSPFPCDAFRLIAALEEALAELASEMREAGAEKHHVEERLSPILARLGERSE